jgi:hypothetical protein
MRLLALLLMGLLAGCASVADLKPGTLSGGTKDGFEQTNEGLTLTVRGRSLEDVWAATLRGANVVARTRAYIRIVDQQPNQFIKMEGRNPVDSSVFYTGLFLVPLSDAIQVQATKLYLVRWVLVPYGPSEADYLRAIQGELSSR